jgi:hypothetical protein
MGELIQFPERREPEVELRPVPDACEGVIHVFTSVPGWCECGENEWKDDHTITEGVIGLHEVPPP